MTKIDSIFPQLAQDKANHALYGVLWGLLGAWLAPTLPALALTSAMGAVAQAALAGVLKEVVDHFTGGDVDPLDAIATAAGGAAIAAAILIG